MADGKSRRYLLAGNWKMNTNRESGKALAQALVDQVGSITAVDIAVCPPYPYLGTVGQIVGGSRIALGAQDVYPEADGAFTGEVSTAMLRDVGCAYVILGHSERRHVMGETDDQVNRKVHATIAANLRPILCVGELLEEREANRTHEVVGHQLRQGLVGVRPEAARSLTIAYEPVWAIGTGKVATPEQAEDVHAFIRTQLTELFGVDLAQQIAIQYGGSVKPDNAAGLLSKPNIDGALVGGASLKADAFAAIVQAAVELVG